MLQAPIGTRPMAVRPRRKGRSRLLGGASALAAAVVLLVAPQQAAAQVAVTGRAFEANPTANPDFSITRSDTQDVVRIFNSSTVINWRPVDTATSSAVIDILPTGNTLAFTGDANFTVLNRVIPDDPTRAIQFNGGVVSLVGGALGGNVWFYSPGGIIAGPSSVFLVGGLVLTSSNMTGIGAGGTQMNFLGANAGSRVEVQPGAQLLASNYVVLWAPRVVQSGGVAAGGNVSYVGAEQGTLTVTGGLFNMVIDVGTDDPNGVVHTGITTGGTPVDNPVRAITMATVAKNDFVNMLVGGAVGYADASVATAGNGIIVLSAANGAQPNSGNITIGPALLNSTTLANASGDLTIALNGQSQALTIGSATNESDFLGLAGRNLTINATSGATVNAADNFFAQAASPGQGGVLTVNIDDAGRDNDSSFSGLLVGGNLTLSAFGNGVDNIPVSPLAVAVSPTFGGDGNGGTIGINVSQGGELFVGGTTLFSAAGTAGIGGLFSGDATGGAINFSLNGNNSRVQLGGNALFDVSANRSAPGAVNAGGEVTAGSINLTLNAGSFTFADLTLTANADADDSINATGRFNGAAGGTINLTNTARITGTTLTANALGIGGDGGTSATVSDAGGDGSGGAVSLTNGVGGSLTLQALGVNVSGTGGEGGRGDVLVNGARGGSGFGGDIALSNAGTLAGTPTLTLAAAGTGGNGGAGGASLDDVNRAADGGAAGNGFGGTIDLVANGATTAVQINSLIGAAGNGGTGGLGGEARFFESGNGGAGGLGQGGDISLVSTAGGSLEITAGTGTLTLDSGGAGGAGGDEDFGLNPIGNPGQNGASVGGTVDLLATGGALTVTGNLVADASAVGNQDLRPGATGADSTGGTITTNASGGGDLTTTGGLWLNASAIAAIGNVSAGTGRGGTVDMLMSGAGSSFNVQGQFPLFFANPPRGRAIYVDTSAYEPQSGNPLLQTATGGDTFGGAINLAFTGGNSTIAGRTDLRNFSAALNPLSGVGPGPQLFLNNATATGGTIDIALSNGTHTWGTLDGSVTTFGLGGSAVNGTVRATLDNATLNLIATPGGNGQLNLSTYVAGEISQSDPDAVVLRVLNGSALTANGGISLFADAGHGISTNTITTGNVGLEVDASTVSVATNTIFLGNEAQAFRFPGAVTNTTGAGARAGDLTFSASNGSTITGDVEMSSFATADSGPSGGTGQSGTITYLLDGSTHTGSLDLLSFAEGLGATDVGGTAGQAIAGNQSISILNSALFTGDVQLETLALTYYAGPASGALGDMNSGTLNLVVDSSTADIGVLNVVNNVLASVAADGFAGSNARGPDVNLTVTGSVVDIGDATITLDALGGRGGRDGNGGSGTGGQLRIASDAASTLTINDAGFGSVGTGGDGGDADVAAPGAGGTGAGGVVAITSAGSLTINTLNADTNGVGGRGGFGAGTTSFPGGSGGTGLGGQISLTSVGDLTLPSFVATAIGSGGLGGGSDFGETGGEGGFGQGGQVGLEFSAAPGIGLNLGIVSLNSSAFGGGGGTGGVGVSSGDSGAGGSGGSAAGGISRFRVTGAGANLAFDPFAFNLASTAVGGTGGAGADNLNGGTAGSGGDGGAATGGTIALEAGSGATLSLLQVSAGPFQLEVSGTGGAGGSGGSIDMINGGVAGAGGDGGNGTGGSPTLRAVGGLITVGDIDIRATGIGGTGGTGGTDGTVTLGAQGNGGNGFGGKPLLETLDGSPGRLTLGTVVIDASGIGGGGTLTGLTGGGQITITDASADPAGLITMGSLTVTAGGPLTPPGTPSLTIESNSGPITVAGDVSATVAGDINFLFDGTGRLAAGGSTTLDAGGNIALTHSGNATGVVSLNTGTDLIATAGVNFIAGAGSIINAGRDVSITAQNIQFASIAAVRDLLLTATNGNITGVGAAGLTSGRVLDLDATQAIAIGDIESDLSIALTAGTTVTAGNLTSTGTDTIGDERIDIVAGGDVSLGTVDAIDGLAITGAGLTATSLDGQSVNATMTGAIDVGTATSETTIALSGTAIALDNGDAPGNITLDASAGGIALGTVNSETDLLATATGNIAFTALTGRVVTLDAGGSITGGTAAADRAVASGVSRNVNLTAVGDVAITSASAVADVVVRGASFTATGAVNSGTTIGDDIDVVVSGAIDIGSTSSGGQTVLTGSLITLGSGVAGLGTSVLTATTGSVDLGTFDSEEFLDIVSATTVDFVTLTARALSIDAVGDVTGTRAAADLDLTSGRPRNVTVTTDGAINIAQLAAIDSVVARGASFTATSVTGGTGLNDNIDVLVGGAIDIGSTSSGGQTVLNGSSITLGSGVAGLGTSVLTATTGAVDLGTFDSEEFLDIVSATTVDFVTLTARALSIDAVGNVTGSRAAADLALASGRPRNVSVTTDGAIDIAQLSAVDSVVLRGASLASTSISSGTGLNANIDVLVGGAIDIGSTSSGGQTVLTGSSIILGSGVAGAGASVLTSTVGNVDLGTFDSENFLDIVSAGSVDFDTLTARALSIDAQANVTGTRAATDLDLVSGRPRNIRITAVNAVSVDQLAAIDNVIVDAFTLNTLDVTARGDLLATLVGVGNLTSINTGGDATVTGSSLAIGDGVSGGLALLTATVGDVDLGTWDAQGFFDIDAAGSVNFDSVTGRLVEIIAAGDITGNFAASDVALASGRPRNVTLDGGGLVSIGEARSIGNVLLDGVSIDAGIVNAAGTVTATGTGAVAVDSLTAGTNATVQGASVALIDGTVGGFLRGNATAGNLGITGTLTVSGNIDLDATGNIGFGTLASTTGVLDARAGGGITFTSAASPINVTLIAGGLISGGTITGRDAVVTGGSVDLDDVTMTGLVTLTSTVGDLVSGNVSSANAGITATAAGALRLGDVTAAGNIVLGSTGNTTVGNVNAGSQVTFNTGGDLIALDIVGSGGTPGLDINVGGDAQLGSVTSGGQLDIDVGGDLTGNVLQAAGTLTVDAASIAITRANSDAFGVALRSTVGGVTADLLTATGSIQVTSATGAALGTLDAGANIDVTAGGNSTLGGATADGNLTVTVTGNLTSVALGAGATPGSILDLNVTGNAQVASAQSGFILDVDVGGALTGGNFASGAATVDAGSLDVTRVAGTGGGGVLVNATTGNALVGTIDSGGNARVNALAGVANVGTLNAALLGEVIARSVTLNTGTIGGNLRLQATAGNVAGTGSIDVAGAIDLDATGNIGFGTLAARGGALTADAGADITFTGASALGSLTLAAGGGVSGGDISGNFVTIGAGTSAMIGNVSAGGRTSITAGGLATFISITSQLSVGISAAEIAGGDISTPFAAGDNLINLASTGELTVGNITSGESTSLVAGGALVAGTIRSIATDGGAMLVRGNGVTADAIITPVAGGGGITVDGGTGAVTIGSFAAGNVSTIAGASLALGPVDVRGSLGLIATNGSILANRGIAVVGGLSAQATGNIALSTLTSGGRTLVDAGGSVSFDDITSQLSVTIDAASITGGDITTPFAAGDNIVALTTTGDMTLGDVSSGETTTLTAGGALVAGTIRATATDGATITIQSQGARIGALIGEVVGGGAISVDGGAGAVDLGTLVSGSDAIVTGESIALAAGDIRGSLSLTSTLGDIALSPDGTSQIRVGRSTTLTSGDSILLTHTNNTDRIVSLASTGNIVAQAETGIIGAAGSALSGNEVFILAGRDVDLADVRAVPALVITAGGSVTLANATVTGPQGLSNLSGIVIDAGLNPGGGSAYDNTGNVSITGTIQSYSGIGINAGGRVDFAAGSQTLAGNRIAVSTGDDIIIGTGALLQSARDTGLVIDPATPFASAGAIDLNAGGLTPLFSTPLTPIASLVVDGSVDAGRGAVIARANAIDGIDGAFAGSSLSFDIDNAPVDGAVLSDDNGLLTAPCVEGNVCLGSIAASNQLLVGQASPDDVLSLTIEQGTVNAREIRIATRNDIVMGTSGIATTLNASDLFTASSRAGNVDLRDATIVSDLIRIEAAGSLLGSASLTSIGDIGVTVGDSLFASAIVAGGELTTAAAAGELLEGSFSVPGTLAVGTLSLGEGVVNYTAGAIDIGQLTVPGTQVRLVATGALSLGQTTGATSLDLQGGSVAGGDLSASGDIAIRSSGDVDLVSAAAGGSISLDLPGNLTFTALRADGDITATAGGAANGGDLDAQGTVTLDAARIVIGSATGSALALTSATDVRFDALSSPNSIAITAATGTIGGNTTAGLIETGGDLTLRARSIDLRDLAAGGAIDIAVTGNVLTLGRLDAGTDIVLGSAGSVVVDHAEAAGDFTATSALGFATGPNSIVTGGNIVINAGGPAVLGNSIADGLIDVNASQIDFASLVAGTTIELTTVPAFATAGGTGNITGGSLQAGAGTSSLVTTAGDIALTGTAVVGGDLFINANGGSAALGGQTTANGLLRIGATTTITAGNLASATGDVIAEAAQGITLANASAANDVRLLATAGSIAFANLGAGRDINVAAANSVSGTTITAGRDGDVQADSDGSGTGDLVLTGLARAVRNLNLFGANVTLANVAVTGVVPAPAGRLSGFVTINSTNGDVQVGDVTAPGMTIVAEGGNLVAGNLDAFDPVLAFGLPTIIDLSAFGGDITVGSLSTVGDVAIFNGGGALIRVLGTTTVGNDLFFSGSGQFRFDGAVTAGRDVDGLADDAVAGGVVFGAGLAAGRNVRVVAANGAIALLTGASSPSVIGGNLTLTARDLTLAAVDVGGDLALTASAGSLDATDVGRVGGSIALVAGGDVTFGALSAGGSSFTVDAGRAIAFDAAGSGGSIGMTAADTLTGGDLTAPGTISLDAARIAIGDATAGSFAIASGSDILFDSVASASGITLTAANGRIGGNGGPGNLTSGGDAALLAREIALGTVDAAGSVTGQTTVGDMTFARLLSGGDITLNSAGSIAVDHAEATGDFTATADGAFATGANSILTGGDIVIDADGPVTLGNSSAGGLVDVRGSQIDFATLAAGTTVALVTEPSLRPGFGNGNVTGTRVTAGADVSISSVSGIAFGTIEARGGASLQSTGSGTIAGTGITAGAGIAATTGGSLAIDTVSAGTAVNLDAAGGISLSTLIGSTARLAAAGGEVRVSVQIDVPGLVEASGQSVFLRSTRNLAVQATATAGDIDVLTTRDLDVRGAEATGGDIRLTSVDGVASVAGVNAAVAASGSATGGNVSIDAGENLDVTGAVTAANVIDLRAGERASIGAAVVGREIGLRASDVAISSAGSLGTLDRTRSIGISGGGIARIGGADGSTPGFVIDNAEFSRIRASGSIAISASTAIILDTLDIRVASGTTADGNLRGEGRLDFAAAEGIDIVGEVIMTGATADNAIGLSTRGDVFLDASTGLLEINDGAGNYLGLIEIEAMNFHAMTEQARTDAQAATDIGAINDRLAQNDGIDNPDGLIRTGTLDIATIASDVFIQNTAAGTAFADRRGFTVDELLIADRNGTNQPIVINGIIAGATGVDAVTLAQISSTFDPGSTINGCLIANPSGCIQLPEVLRGIAFPVQDLIETELEEDAPGEPGLGAGVVDAPLIELRDPLDTSEDPLLDDPVTGAGNEDLWVGEQPGV